MLTLASGLAWMGFYFINQAFLQGAHYSAGIDLVYIPAGVRLGIVLVCGIWGAIGIAVANPMLFYLEFGEKPLFEVGLNSIIAGFAPLAVVVMVLRLMGVERSLHSLKAIHLPILALLASLITPSLFNLFFLAFGYKQADEFWTNLSAMVLGDFLGCMLVLYALWCCLKLYRMLNISP